MSPFKMLLGAGASLWMVVGLFAHPLDTRHTRYSGSGYLYGVVWGNGLFVAVGGSGAILTSTTGVSWTSQASGTNATLHGVAYGNGVFVAVGANGAVLSSPDGTNWTQRLSGTTASLRCVQFGNGMFVATGASPMILTSEDGLNWSLRNPGIPFGQDFIAYGNGLFVLAGSRGTNAVSADGTNWFPCPSGTGSLYTVGFGNGLFLAIDNLNHVFTSSDATNWVQRGSVSVVRPGAIAGGNTCFVIPGVVLHPGAGSFQYSQDGSSWTLVPSVFINAVAFGDSSFVAVGSSQTILQSDPVVWLSPCAPGTFEITGPVGRSCGIDMLESLQPGAEWQPLTNFTLPASPFTWTDTDAPNSTQRFYRVGVDP